MPPSKVCPQCETIVHARLKVCKSCEHVFRAKRKTEHNLPDKAVKRVGVSQCQISYEHAHFAEGLHFSAFSFIESQTLLVLVSERLYVGMARVKSHVIRVKTPLNSARATELFLLQ